MEMGGKLFKNMQSGSPCYSVPKSKKVYISKNGILRHIKMYETELNEI